MVLHNSKWDKKARKQYLKKHGLNVQKEVEKRDVGEDLKDNSWRFRREEEETEGEERSELSFFPEENELFQDLEEENDLKNLELAKEIARKKVKDQQSSDKEHVTHITKKDEINEFKELSESIERSKMLAKVKRQFGPKKKVTAKKVDEEDFDEFFQSVDQGEETTSSSANNRDERSLNFNMEKSKQEYIDGLIGL